MIFFSVFVGKINKSIHAEDVGGVIIQTLLTITAAGIFKIGVRPSQTARTPDTISQRPAARSDASAASPDSTSKSAVERQNAGRRNS